MIQCNSCMVWQHAGCVWNGLQVHFCEQCRPDLRPSPPMKLPSQNSKSKGGMSYPPPLHTESTTNNLTATNQRFTHPTQVVPTIQGRHRRTSSGSGDRGVGGLLDTFENPRISPYPSPYSSRYLYPIPYRSYSSPSTHTLLAHDPLPTLPSQNLPVPLGIEQDGSVSLPVYGTSSLGFQLGDIGELGVQPDFSGSPADGGRSSGDTFVPFVPGISFTASSLNYSNVMNTTMEGISGSRRKGDANFLCSIPGCGSTFIRRSNLKTHMRSHNKGKPFQCKWPGCGKGFARANDCKRHEYLHFIGKLGKSFYSL